MSRVLRPLTLQIIATDRNAVEHDLTDIAQGTRLSWNRHGGCGVCSFHVPQLFTQRYSWLDLLNLVVAYDAKTGTAIWWGRIAETPWTIGDEEGVDVVAVGAWDDTLADLTWRRTFKETDLGELSLVPYQASAYDVPEMFSHDTNSRIFLQVRGGAVYPAGYVKVAYRYRIPAGEEISRVTASWDTVLIAGDKMLMDIAKNGGTTGAARIFSTSLSGAQTGTLDVGSLSGVTHLDFELWAAGFTGADNALYWGRFIDVVLYGSGNATPSTIISECLGHTSGEVSTSTAGITPSTHVYASFAVRDSIPIRDIMDRANSAEGSDIGVYGDNVLYYGPRPTTATCFTRLDLGTTYQMAKTADGLADSAIVPYESDAAADYDKKHLELTVTATAPELTAAGVSRHVALSSKGRGSVDADATADGYFAGQAKTAVQPSGTLAIPMGALFSLVSGEVGAPLDPWMLFAPTRRGGLIQIQDLLPVDDSLDTTYDARTTGAIASAEWGDAELVLSVTLDASDPSYEAQMERMALDLATRPSDEKFEPPEMWTEYPESNDRPWAPTAHKTKVPGRQAWCRVHGDYHEAAMVKRHEKAFRKKHPKSRWPWPK